MKNIFLADQTVTPAASGGSSLMIMGLFLLAFWFLLIAPQRRKQKEQEKMIAQLKSGDEIMTTSGIIGVIVQVKSNCLLVKSGDSKFEIHKSFVQSKLVVEKTKNKFDCRPVSCAAVVIFGYIT